VPSFYLFFAIENFSVKRKVTRRDFRKKERSGVKHSCRVLDVTNVFLLQSITAPIRRRNCARFVRIYT